MGGLVGGLALFVLPPASKDKAIGDKESERHLRPGIRPLLACLAIAVVQAGAGMIGYFLLIGKDLGFAQADSARLIAVAMPLSLLGPLAARSLGQRIGLLAPLLIAMLLMIADIILLVQAPTILAFGACLTLQIALIMFYPAYAIALIARLDPSGRMAGAAVAFLMFGSALAPKLGSMFLGQGNTMTLGLVSAALVALGAILFVLASMRLPANSPLSRQ